MPVVDAALMSDDGKKAHAGERETALQRLRHLNSLGFVSDGDTAELERVLYATPLLSLSNALHAITNDAGGDIQFLKVVNQLRTPLASSVDGAPSAAPSADSSLSRELVQVKEKLNALLGQLTSSNRLTEAQCVAVFRAFSSPQHRLLLDQLQDLVYQKCSDPVLCSWLLNVLPKLDEAQFDRSILIAADPSGSTVPSSPQVERLSASLPFALPRIDLAYKSSSTPASPVSVTSAPFDLTATHSAAPSSAEPIPEASEPPLATLTDSIGRHRTVRSEFDVKFASSSSSSALQSISETTASFAHLDSRYRPYDASRYASREELVQNLLSPHEHVQFRNAFLLCYRAYLTPSDLLSKLIAYYAQPPSCFLIGVNSAENADICRQRVGAVLVSWLRDYFFDDFNETMVNELRSFIGTSSADRPPSDDQLTGSQFGSAAVPPSYLPSTSLVDSVVSPSPLYSTLLSTTSTMSHLSAPSAPTPSPGHLLSGLPPAAPPSYALAKLLRKTLQDLSDSLSLSQYATTGSLYRRTRRATRNSLSSAVARALTQSLSAAGDPSSPAPDLTPSAAASIDSADTVRPLTVRSSSVPVSDAPPSAASPPPVNSPGGGNSSRTGSVGRKSALRSFAAFFSSTPAPPEPVVPQQSSADPILQYRASEIAKALTAISFPLFQNIDKMQLIDHVWKLHPEKAVDATAFIEHFNCTTRWVVGDILRPDDLEQRAAMLRHFVYVATECLKLNNFHAACAILAALKMHPVFRLKELRFVLDERQEELLAALEILSDSRDNYAGYRAALNKCLDDRTPCVPHMAITFRDLYLLQEQTVPERKHKVVDMQRLQRIHDVVQRVQQSQATSFSILAPSATNYYPAPPPAGTLLVSSELVSLLNDRIHRSHSEELLLRRSLDLEPKMTWAQHRQTRALSVLTEEGFA